MTEISSRSTSKKVNRQDAKCAKPELILFSFAFLAPWRFIKSRRVSLRFITIQYKTATVLQYSNPCQDRGSVIDVFMRLNPPPASQNADNVLINTGDHPACNWEGENSTK